MSKTSNAVDKTLIFDDSSGINWTVISVENIRNYILSAVEMMSKRKITSYNLCTTKLPSSLRRRVFLRRRSKIHCWGWCEISILWLVLFIEAFQENQWKYFHVIKISTSSRFTFTKIYIENLYSLVLDEQSAQMLLFSCRCVIVYIPFYSQHFKMIMTLNLYWILCVIKAIKTAKITVP